MQVREPSDEERRVHMAPATRERYRKVPMKGTATARHMCSQKVVASIMNRRRPTATSTLLTHRKARLPSGPSSSHPREAVGIRNKGNQPTPSRATVTTYLNTAAGLALALKDSAARNVPRTAMCVKQRLDGPPNGVAYVSGGPLPASGAYDTFPLHILL